MQSEVQQHHEYTCPTEPHQFYFINQHTIMLLIDDTFGTVYATNGKLKCSCSSHHGFCKFTQIIQQMLDTPSNDQIALLADSLKEPVVKTDLYQQTSVSSHLIEFCG